MARTTPPKRSGRRTAASAGDTSRRARSTSLFEIVPLPCLRCGLLAVPVGLLPFMIGGCRSTVDCRRCETPHLLAIKREADAFEVLYQRYTLRYPLEYYDEGEEPPIVRFDGDGESQPVDDLDENVWTGPIVIYPRKERFRSTEVKAIWRASASRCHICGRPWELNERGVRGWHIDHVIPHVGGGRDSERLSNFRVACARCNLRKGRGYTEALVRSSLGQLVERLNATRSKRLLAPIRGHR
jgi:hypothetical protein